MFHARPLRSVLVLLVLSIPLACTPSSTEPGQGPDPGGPGEGTDPGPEPPPPPPPPTASVPRGTPAIYISTSTDASVFNDIIGEVIEGSQQNFVQLVPATGEAALIDSNRSVSYAQSRSTIKTFDDELYIVNVSEVGARLRRFDLDALLASPADRPIPTPRTSDSIDEDCFVVQGEDIVYKVAWRQAPFPGTGYSDGPLLRVANFFGGGTEITTLIDGIGGDSPTPGGYITDACQFNMDWADGVWYDVASLVEANARAIYTRDPVTGEATEVGLFQGQDAFGPPNSVTNLGFDLGMAYYAYLDGASQTIHVAGRAVDGDLWTLQGSFEIEGFTAESVRTLDVDDGHVTFVVDAEGGDDYIALFDAGAATPDLDLFSVGAPVNQLQIMYRD